MAGKSSQKYSQKQAVKQRIAAQQAQVARAERRRRLMLGAGGTVAVVAVIVALVIVSITTGSSVPKEVGEPTAGPQPAPKALVSNITEISASTFGKVPAELPDNPPKKIDKDLPPLTKDGKPEMLYIGGEFCPYCAGERWAMVAALSRFGEFHDLKTVYSTAEPGIPALPTLSFRGATYTSDYLTFTPVEAVDRNHQPLETPSKAQSDLMNTLGVSGYPFVDIGNQWLQSGSSVNPSLLAGHKPQDVAQAVDNTNSPLGKAILTSANALTAAICDVTNGQPANVCSSDTIQSVQDTLAATSK